MSGKGYKKTVDNVNKVIRSFGQLAFTNVLVGIPQSEAERDEGENSKQPVTNAQLAYIHTHGSPVNNIPARPFIQPAVKDNIEVIRALQKQIVEASVEGKKDRVKKLNNRLGMLVAAKAKQYITHSGKLAPNSPYTIARKKAKAYHQKNKRIAAKEPKPLIDTGQMLNAITYVVEGP